MSWKSHNKHLRTLFKIYVLLKTPDVWVASTQQSLKGAVCHWKSQHKYPRTPCNYHGLTWFHEPILPFESTWFGSTVITENPHVFNLPWHSHHSTIFAVPGLKKGCVFTEQTYNKHPQTLFKFHSIVSFHECMSFHESTSQFELFVVLNRGGVTVLTETPQVISIPASSQILSS